MLSSFCVSRGAVALAVVAFAGSAASRARAGEPRPHAVAAKDAPDMQATGTFFKGKVSVTVLLSRVGFEVAKPNASGTQGSPAATSHAFRAARRPGGGVMPHAEPAPDGTLPLRFHLLLANHRGAPLVVEIRRFESPLGDFTVTPVLNLVPARGTTVTEPIVPQRHAAGGEVPVTLELRMGRQHEVQTLVLRATPEAAASHGRQPAG